MREFALLQEIYKTNASLGAQVTLGPGDDMGEVIVEGQRVLATVDQLAEGIHFDRRTASAAQIARKALTRNLSDVAAMAALPVGALCAAMLPRDSDEAFVRTLREHLHTTGNAFACPIFGGDLSIWDGPLMLTLTILAEARGIEPVLRHTARAGDALLVTGTLGGSGLCIEGYTHHLDFTPRLQEARTLAGDQRWRPTAMIDLSDGLAGDLGHLLEQDPTLAAVVEVESLPLSKAAHQAARASGRPPWQHALSDGEDYELLLAAPAEQAMPGEVGGVPLTRIGQLVRLTTPTDTVAQRITLREKGKVLGTLAQLNLQGWEHGA